MVARVGPTDGGAGGSRGGPTSGARRDSPHLTAERIHAAALRLVDVDGIDALSMRKLAATMGVNPMSLYHHVPNKAALLRGICGLAVAELDIPVRADADWRGQLRQIAHSYRSLAHRHGNLITYLIANPGFIQRDGALWTALCETLARAGIPAEEVVRIGNVLLTFVSGFILAEVNGTLGDLLRSEPPSGDDEPGDDDEGATARTGTDAAETGSADTAEFDRSFEAGLELVIAGLEAHGATASASSKPHPPTTPSRRHGTTARRRTLPGR
jgi:AcrR family transcriptional regulator